MNKSVSPLPPPTNQSLRMIFDDPTPSRQADSACFLKDYSGCIKGFFR